MKLKNKIALVTGGGRGIGKAICEEFAAEGAFVIAVARTAKEIDVTVKEIRSKSGDGLAIPADISSEDQVNTLLKNALTKVDRIDILVNNAGVQQPIGPLALVGFEEWRRNLEVNLLGAVLCTKAVLPIMMRQGKGKIINSSGGGATSPRPCFSAYACSKTALVRLTETLAQELQDYNIDVNAIAPGAVNTGMTEEVAQAGPLAGTREAEEAQRRLAEGGIDPQLAAQLAVFLASEASNGLTGRLISAVWDDWQNWDRKRIQTIMKTESYTLRRIMP